ncbi:glycoside hydrolase family 99-like domain-containing protein [Phyllobacterium sp. TAF24]|uniref:glycosyltransferase WbsX family protein n=1 Tax=Phyllobacterium sp. TAF24 TaxID=3233068 RepID=UPI003F9BD664
MTTPPILVRRANMIKPIAFYLPQFHPVKENSEWWGPGFTEWTNVAKARPNFEGHNQPQIPRDLGFYDLRMAETMQAQIELAKANSIFGFCFYYYWFSGRRILEKPIDVFVNNKIDFPFCFCWANENWTKRWDGGNNEILLANEHSVENDNRFIDDVIPYMRDDRYIRYDGLPLIIIYRPDILTDSKATFAHWRKRAKEAGLPGLFIASVAFYDIFHPDDWGADALVEFPPHQYLGNAFSSTRPRITNPEFRGNIMDYRSVMTESINRRHDDFLFFHGAMPSWDNTARRQNDPFTFINSSPELFELWLRNQSLKTSADEQNKEKFVFINAWNEWAEGCHLEPCLKYGHQHLEAVHRSVNIDRYVTPTPPHDNVMGALASIENYDLGNFKYLSGLEIRYSEALADISHLKAHQIPAPVSLASAIAQKLRGNPIAYRIARKIFRTMRKVRGQ